ncbi:MAG: ATP-binding region ATPase domain protein [Gemmatimonadetes bacterium]|nr:ATP-binding region ATPase domain protein [Gemmatimonadota bacterium]
MISRRSFRIAATVGPALVTLAIGAFSLVALTRLGTASDAVAHSREITESLQTLLARLTDAETSQRGYLLTGSREYLNPGAGAAADVHRALGSARRLISDATEQRRLDTLSTVISEKLKELESARRAYDALGLAAATAVVRSDSGQTLMRTARKLIANIEGAERARLEQRQAHEAQLRVITTALIFAAIVLAGLLSLFVNTILGRALAAREAADQRRQKALSELESANEELTAQAVEMEAQTVELEQANEELRSVTDDLARQREAAERASERVVNVLDTMSDAFISFDRDWKIRRLNREGTRLTNNTGPSIIGRDLWELWGPWVAPELATKMREAMAGETVAPFEFEVAPDLWFEIRMNGMSDGLAIFFRDITSQRRARVEREQLIEQAQAEHRRLVTVVEQSPLAISIVEAPSGRRIVDNRAAEEVMGIPMAESLSATTSAVKGFKEDGTPLSPADWPLARAIGGGKVVINEMLEIERPSGERRRICINSAPVHDAQGNVDAGVAIFWDVTEQHKAEQELRSARHEAETASRAKSEFLAVMSHELRTPLSAIIGYEELLFDGITGPVNEAQRTQLARIKASATHLLSLIDEVLTLSRVEAGREVAHPERVSAFAALHEASTIAEPLASEKQLELKLARVPKDIELWADPTKLRQILLNLITNAIKFTDAGSVVLESSAADDCVEILVRDTGIGIAPSDHDRIFDTFWQVEQKSTRKVGGTGLGLSVSRRLARLMSGDLTVESKLGAGSTFTLRLPRHRK